VGQNDALQRQSYPDYQRYTCREVQGSESEVVAQQRDSTQRLGARYVDDVTAVKIEGDRAVATVTYHFDKSPAAKHSSELLFARRDGSWTVCSSHR
jgi:hypothetical protein